MKAIVIGATGATGKELVNLLLDSKDFSEVHIWVRRKHFNAHPKLKEQIIDFNLIHNFASDVNADVAFSCLGTTLKDAGSKDAQWKVDYEYQLNFAQICSDKNVSQFVLLSAKNANSKSNFFYGKMKGQLEEEVKKLDFKKLLIFRPGLLDRPNSERFSEKMGVSILKTLNSLGIFRKFASIKVPSLAFAMIKSVQIYPEGIHSVELNDIFKLISKNE